MVAVKEWGQPAIDARCPHCAHAVEPKAKSCSRCGHDLPRSSSTGLPVKTLIAAVAIAGSILAMRLRRGRRS